MSQKLVLMKPLVLAAALLLAASLPAWGQGLPRSLRISTNPQGSIFYSAGSNVAKILSKHLPLKARVQPYSGTSVALPLVNSGEVELGLNNTNDVRMAYRGLKPFIPSPKLRLINVMFTLRVAAFVHHNNKSVMTLTDLRGKRVTGDFSAQLAVWYNATSILGGAGLGWKDVKKVSTANVITGTQLLIEGKVDAAFFAIGAGKTREANATIPGGIRWLSINASPAGVRKMQEIMPGTYPLKVKKGSAPGVREDIVVEAYDAFIVSSPSLSDEAAAAIVMTLAKNEAEVRKSFRPFRPFSAKKMAKTNVTIPYHTGAIKAYRELGLWSADLERLQAKLLSEAAR
ncbi:MAG: TAXI family TRAP transporter solute-binding subunit [bacterium]